MNRENPVVLEDIRHICSDTNISWSKLTGKTVLVTGSTGLIGKLIVKALCAKDGIHVIVMARTLSSWQSIQRHGKGMKF